LVDDPLALARALRDAPSPEAEAALLAALTAALPAGREQRGRLVYYRLPPGSDAPRTRSEARACADWLDHVHRLDRPRRGGPRPNSGGARPGAGRKPGKAESRLVPLPCRVTPEARAVVEGLPSAERSAWVSAAILAREPSSSA